MVKTADEAAANYERGVKLFGGAETYKRCGEKKNEGFLAVARCLSDSKKSALTLDLMVTKYRAAAGH
ncbi:MAG: hypothetical protein QXE05_06115 [Nitrososphaeria archaeon]